MKTLDDVKVERKLSEPKTCQTKVELNFTKIPATACVVPAGTTIQIHFSEVRPERVYFEYAGSVRALLIVNAHKKLTGFSKMPSMASLERYSNDGIAKTCTGHRTEPDGYGPDGSPSWLLVAGVI